VITSTFQAHQNEKIAGCLDWLHREALSPNRFQIRYLEDLSLELFAHANKNVSESSILEMLTTSAFDYEPNTRYSTIVSVVVWNHYVFNSAVL